MNSCADATLQTWPPVLGHPFYKEGPQDSLLGTVPHLTSSHNRKEMREWGGGRSGEERKAEFFFET